MAALWQMPAYLNLAWPDSKVAVLARFRLRNHFLRIEMGGWGVHRLDPADRLCVNCSMAEVVNHQPRDHDSTCCCRCPSWVQVGARSLVCSLPNRSCSCMEWAWNMSHVISYLQATEDPEAAITGRCQASRPTSRRRYQTNKSHTHGDYERSIFGCLCTRRGSDSTQYFTTVAVTNPHSNTDLPPSGLHTNISPYHGSKRVPFS
jgi:hypothetical protein